MWPAWVAEVNVAHGVVSRDMLPKSYGFHAGLSTMVSLQLYVSVRVTCQMPIFCKATS